MNLVVKRLTAPFVIAACLVGASGTALATSQSAPPQGVGLLPATTAPSAAEIRYRKTVNQALFNRFGHGGTGRNLYCAGPAIIRFQILPNGRTAHAALVRRSLPELDARLVATITNMVFPRFEPGMPERPYPLEYKYGVWTLAQKSLAARTNCR